MANNTHRIQVRLTDEEYKQLIKQKKFLEYSSYANLIRMYIHTGICYKINYSGFSDLAHEIALIGNNINQIAMIAK